jgi:hypothetical protein
LLEPNDVAPVLGMTGAAAWMQTVARQDLVSLTRELLYRVEAGSARKPNKATRVEQMQLAVQTLGPILSQLVGAGMVAPFNALMKDWASSLDIDSTPYLLPPPPPPAPPSPPPSDVAAAEGGGGGPPALPAPPPPQIPGELQP